VFVSVCVEYVSFQEAWMLSGEREGISVGHVGNPKRSSAFCCKQSASFEKNCKPVKI